MHRVELKGNKINFFGYKHFTQFLMHRVELKVGLSFSDCFLIA